MLHQEPSSSTLWPFDSIIDVPEYWIARFRGRRRLGVWRGGRMTRHCERSEAIHLAAQRKNGLLRRFARNDVKSQFQTRVCDLAARCARGVAISSAQKRAWGTPDARCTRGLVCTWYW